MKVCWMEAFPRAFHLFRSWEGMDNYTSAPAQCLFVSAYWVWYSQEVINLTTVHSQRCLTSDQDENWCFNVILPNTHFSLVILVGVVSNWCNCRNVELVDHSETVIECRPYKWGLMPKLSCVKRDPLICTDPGM